ncbi:unnamed protein product, partial [marine sediment metagenome]
MKVLALEKELIEGKTDDYKSYLRKESLKVWEYYQKGIIREIYFRKDESLAVLIIECINVKEARELLEKLPLVREGFIDFEIIPLIPYPGFARLFNKKIKKEINLERNTTKSRKRRKNG